MVTRNYNWTSRIALVAAIMISGCTNKVKQQEDGEEGAVDSNSTISTESVLSAVPDIDELAQYYGQGYDIPDELNGRASFRTILNRIRRVTTRLLKIRWPSVERLP
jgi:hypothetical protein